MKSLRAKLNVEQMGDRVTPSAVPWSSVDEFWAPGTMDLWMPNRGDIDVLVTSADMGSGDIRNVVLAGVGGSCRVVVVNRDGTGPEFDRVLMDPAFRGGVGDAVQAGEELAVAPDDGGGAVFSTIDLKTWLVTDHAVEGFDPNWRGGVQFTTADVDAVNGSVSVHPQSELIVMPGRNARFPGGPVAFVIDTASWDIRFSMTWGDPNSRERWQPVPASAGALLQNPQTQEYLGMGMLVEPAGQKPDPVTHTAALTVGITWDGKWYEHRWDTSRHAGFVMSDGTTWWDFYGVPRPPNV